MEEENRQEVLRNWNIFRLDIFLPFSSRFFTKDCAKPRSTWSAATSGAPAVPTMRCQFHQHFKYTFFVQKCFAQICSNYSTALQFFGKRILAQKLLVKYWWNWLQDDEGGAEGRQGGDALPLPPPPLNGSGRNAYADGSLGAVNRTYMWVNFSYNKFRLFHGFRLTKQGHHFWACLDHFWIKNYYFLRRLGQYWKYRFEPRTKIKVSFVQICETLCSSS